MATASAPRTPKVRPAANLFDIPELLPGAKPSCNPAQREEFEQRCRLLHQEEVKAERATVAAMAECRAAEHRNALEGLEAMFPNIDPALVRSLAAEAPTPQHAIETLLLLASTMAEPVIPEERPQTPPPLDLGFQDLEKFPSLVDGEGWQVGSQRQFQRDPEEDLGSAWRDRAKAAQKIAAPKPVAAPVVKRRANDKKEEQEEDKPEPQQFPTDYEWRQRAGQRRAAKYGKGKGSAPTGTARGKGPKPPKDDDSSSSEESEDLNA